MLNAIRPLKNQPEQLTTKADLTKLKYSVLVQVMKKESPKIKPLISLVSVVVKNSKQIENDLLKEKLLQIEGGVKLSQKKGSGSSQNLIARIKLNHESGASVFCLTFCLNRITFSPFLWKFWG